MRTSEDPLCRVLEGRRKATEHGDSWILGTSAFHAQSSRLSARPLYPLFLPPAACFCFVPALPSALQHLLVKSFWDSSLRKLLSCLLPVRSVLSGNASVYTDQMVVHFKFSRRLSALGKQTHAPVKKHLSVTQGSCCPTPHSSSPASSMLI